MGCCGDKRRELRGAAPGRRREQVAGEVASPMAGRHSRPCFQYVGATGLTVIGPISKQRYRFAARGSILPVDPRDRPSLATVPNLRQVRPR